MHIVFEGEIFARQAFGGISRYFAELSRGFLQRGHSVTNICPLQVNQYIETIPGINHIGFRVPLLPKSNRTRAFLSNRIARYIRINSGDIFHETYYRNIRRSQKMPFVTTIYDMIYEKSGEKFHDLDYMIRAKRQSLENADQVICISEWTRNDLLNVYPQFENKSVVIHLGNRGFEEEEIPFKQEPKHPFLLYVGLRGGYKNFEILIESFSTIYSKNTNISLAIFGGPALSNEELSIFAKFALPPNSYLHITGSDKILAWLYKNAIAFIYPSLSEGFGMPLVEAMSQKCPVICSNASCFPEVCGDAAIYFDPSSKEDLSEKIRSVIEYSVDERAHLVTKGLARSSIFSWDRCVDKTLATYQQLL